MEDSKELVAYQQDPNYALKRKDVARALFESGLFPNVRNPAGAFAVVQYGSELGLAPMVSLQNINVINGKLAANGQVMLSLALARGVSFQVLTETEKECSIKFVKGQNQYISHFSLKDAEEAGLTGKDNWKKWRKDMLFWRCVAKGVRRIDPTSVMGLYTPDELTDGEVVDVTDYQAQPGNGQVVEEMLVNDLPPPPEDHEPTIEAYEAIVGDYKGISTVTGLKNHPKVCPELYAAIKGTKWQQLAREAYKARLAELEKE